MSQFEVVQANHVSREKNCEVDSLALKQLETFIVAILGYVPPKFQGRQILQDIIHFL